MLGQISSQHRQQIGIVYNLFSNSSAAAAGSTAEGNSSHSQVGNVLCQLDTAMDIQARQVCFGLHGWELCSCQTCGQQKPKTVMSNPIRPCDFTHSSVQPTVQQV